MAKLNSRMKQHRCDQRSQSPLAPDMPGLVSKKIGWSPWRLSHHWEELDSEPTKVHLKQKADEEIRTLDPLLGKEMLYHWATSAGNARTHEPSIQHALRRGHSSIGKMKFKTKKIKVKLGKDTYWSEITRKNENTEIRENKKGIWNK